MFAFVDGLKPGRIAGRARLSLRAAPFITEAGPGDSLKAASIEAADVGVYPTLFVEKGQ
jgi:hypothetical protein